MGTGGDTGPEHGDIEVATDALEEGDRPISGGALAPLRIPVFRRVFLGAFISNVGSWMQNVVLGAIAYDLTDSAVFVGVLLFAQLGPMLLFSMVGGLLADLVDRRRLLITVAVTQGLLSLGLAWAIRAEDPSKVALVVLVFLIGVGQSIYGPAYSALLPVLVGRQNLKGAISLNSAQMNGSRVIGPAIGSALLARWGGEVVFTMNAATYLVVIAALLSVQLPAPPGDPSGERGIRRLLSGLRVARQDRVIGRCLSVIVLFSLLSLPFIGQLPTLADRNLGIESTSTEYGYLYALFGLGALSGALSIGTALKDWALERVVRSGLLAFAVALGAFSLLRSPAPAYVLIVVVGFFYFAVITSLSTVLQERVDDANRGRVMALWMMGFGGMVPVGNLVAGPLIEWTSVTTVVLAGAVVAVWLAWYADVRPHTDERSPAARDHAAAR